MNELQHHSGTSCAQPDGRVDSAAPIAAGASSASASSAARTGGEGEPLREADAQLQRHQVHHSYMWLGSIRMLVVLLFTLAISSLSSIISLISTGNVSDWDDLTTIAVLGGTGVAIVVVIALIAVYQVVSYKHLYFTLGAAELNVYQGIFNKKRVHVPYQRVQSVDQRASLLQRIFGVCTVSIDTAGGASNKAVTIPYLTKQQAEWLRTELFARKHAVLAEAAANAAAAAGGAGAANAANVAGVAASAANAAGVTGVNAAGTAGSAVPQGASAYAYAASQNHSSGNVLDVGVAMWHEIGGMFAGSAVNTGRVSYEYGLSNKELVFTGLSNNTAFALISLGVIGALAQVVDMVFDVFPKASESVVDGIVSQATGAHAGSFIMLGVLFLVGAVAFMWLLSIVGTCISYGGFRARRRDSRIEVERGLLQHTFQGVDVDRVQAVVVKQTFIRRLVGYCEVSLSKIDAAAQSDDGSQQTNLTTHGVVVHPFVKVSRVPEIVRGLVPEFDGLPQASDSMPVAPVALRRALIRRCSWQGGGFWLAIAVAITQLYMNFVSGAPGVAYAFEVSLTDAETMLMWMNAAAAVAYVLAVVLVVLDAIGALLWFRESSFAYNDRFMQINIGGFSRETMNLPRRKIQFGYTRTNPFQRLARTATINVRTAAGIKGTTVRLVDVRKEDAHAWLDWVRPRGSVIQ